MPIESNCPGCGKLLRVADQYAGRRARCPNCGEIYDVPSRQQEPTQTPETGASESWRLKTADGALFGPAAKSELDAWVAQGRVAASDQLQRVGEAHWRPAPEVYPRLADAPAPSGASSPLGGSAEAAANPYVPPLGEGAAAFQQPHRGGLILALGILGWVICFIFGIVAWVMGHADLQAMAAGRMDDSGRGLTMAGMIIGMVQVILTAIVFGVVLLIAFYAALAH